MRHGTRWILACLAALLLAACGCTPTAVPFAPPAKTAWAPTGCRTVPTADPMTASRAAWRNLHSDAANTDEVSIALAPVLDADWEAEPTTYNPTGPVFDSAGNLYFAPLLPHENVALISLDPTTGARRWSIAGTGSVNGSGAPLVLNDPGNPGGEIVYLALYDRAFAARTDGTILWDVATGLPSTGAFDEGVFGVNYLPTLDALVALSANGRLYALDRATGAPILNAVYSLPGEPSPPGAGLSLPAAALAQVQADLSTLIHFPPGTDFADLAAVLLGNEVEVANFFSIDPATGRLWVAATAPDGADGTVDGVSEFGALYGLDLVANGGGFDVTEACRRDFSGGSASTPALRTDGTRIYVGDNDGNLLAIRPDCTDAWTLSIGSQIVGSVGVASDNGEIYVATARSILQVIDSGAAGAVGWTANLSGVFIPGVGQTNFNLNLYSIAANGIGFQAGSGLIQAQNLPLAVGVGVLDRDTGAVRFFTDGLEETVAVMSTGPDGALYIGNSPLRRAFARALFPGFTPPIEGGIRKFAPRRLDLLVRDAACAARARALNADANQGLCPDSAGADLTQLRELIDEARAAGPKAVTDGDLAPGDWAMLSATLAAAASNLTLAGLSTAAGELGAVCDFFP
ncbi:MAG: PQQ-binding-like beta-propeller repeat protein [Myxococcales bacterium]|nr:PQQ-binding-like beta-propeller repeat protein [Myxococcales bacterium]